MNAPLQPQYQQPLTPQPQKQTLGNFLKQSDSFLQQTLGERKAEFVSNLLALSDADKVLQQCNHAELMKCAMNATALNLPLNKNLGYAYIIPYNEKDKATGQIVKKPQFQMGYKGFIQLAIRSGQYKTINTCELREGEVRRNKFTGHIEFLGENPNGKVVGYLAFIELLNKFQQSLYMTVEEMNAHAQKYSKTYGKGQSVWATDFDAMAKKTVLKLLLNRYGVLSVEMQKAVQIDQADAEGQYIDNPNTVRVVEDAVIIEQNDPADGVRPAEAVQPQSEPVAVQTTIDLKEV